MNGSYKMHILDQLVKSKTVLYLRSDMMPNLNELELQNLRHLIGSHDTIATKLDYYAQQCSDPAIIQQMQKDAQDARTNKENLMKFL